MLSRFFVGKLLFCDSSLEVNTFSSDQVSGGQDVVVVHELNERLDLGSSLDFLLAHSFGYSKRVSFDACNESVSEFLVLLKWD